MWRTIIFAGLLAALPAAHAQDNAPTPFESQIETHRDLFRWIDLGDMRGVRARVRAAATEANGCVAGDCPDFDCPAADGTLERVAELHMRMSAMENALDYMRQLELAHLRSLHAEANLAEDLAAYEREVLYWQGASITFGASLLQVALLAGDVQSLAQADGVWSTGSAIDELIRDSEAFVEDLRSFRTNSTPRFRNLSDNLDSELAELLDLKSNAENLVNNRFANARGQSREAREQLAMIIGRNIRAWALDFLAARQDEVAHMIADAARERAEANEFARRLRGLSLQRELAAQIARESRELYVNLSRCVQNNCALSSSTLPEAPQILRPAGPDSPENMPRLDQETLTYNSSRILELGLTLRPNWIRPQCGLPEEFSFEDTSARDEAAFAARQQIRQDCRTIENVGICSIVTPDRRAACNASAQTAINACVALPELGESLTGLQPMSPAFQAALTDMCVAQCDILYGLDLHLDRQRAVALDQVAALDRDYHQRGGATQASGEQRDAQTDEEDPIADRLRDLRNTAAVRVRFIAYNPASNSYADFDAVPDGHILIATYPGGPTQEEREEADRLQAELEVTTASRSNDDGRPRTEWGARATEFWQTYGPHQFLTCGGAELDRQRSQCEASCQSGGAPAYAACAAAAPNQSFDLGPALYPPDDPRGDEIEPFNAQEALQQAHGRRD